MKEDEEIRKFRRNLPFDMRVKWWWARNGYLIKAIFLSFLFSSLTSYLADKVDELERRCKK